MSWLWSFFVHFWTLLPWVAIGLAAVFALMRHKGSLALMLQALGASCCFILGMLGWLVQVLLAHMGASGNILYGSGIIFTFLGFVSLLTFAVGYCMEKLRRPAVPASAYPVNT